jgi:RNA polymerase sigma factor (sigma-70 family)
MDNSVFGCDVNLMVKKLVSVASKKLNHSDSTELAQDAIGNAYASFDVNNGVSFEQFIWVVYRNRLNDRLRAKYSKGMASLSVETAKNKLFDVVSTSEDLVSQVASNAKELLDNNTINEVEHNIIVLKSHRYTNDEIAKELGLTPGRISQIWGELQIELGN